MKKIVSFLALILLVDTFSGKAQLVADGLDSGSMGQAGIDSGMIKRLEMEVDSGTYPNIHSVLMARNGKLVYEHYWKGKDQAGAYNLGIIAHNRYMLHDMRSISKSFVGACIGIAIAEGKIKSIDEPVLSFFPEYARLDTGMKRTLTLRHLLTMSSGLYWDENRSYTDSLNDETGMDNSPNPLEYVLSRPMVAIPGTHWNYNSGTTEVLGAIIQKVTGKPVDQYAKEHLFLPLGITYWQWIRNPKTGLPFAAAGLRLRSRDLLKFGLLYSQHGQWGGKQLIPAVWVDSSLAGHVARDGGGGYGYLFWTWSYPGKDGAAQVGVGVGNGDQRVFIDVRDSLVVVITSGNYNNFTIRKNADAMMGDCVYPALQR